MAQEEFPPLDAPHYNSLSEEVPVDLLPANTITRIESTYLQVPDTGGVPSAFMYFLDLIYYFDLGNRLQVPPFDFANLLFQRLHRGETIKSDPAVSGTLDSAVLAYNLIARGLVLPNDIQNPATRTLYLIAEQIKTLTDPKSIGLFTYTPKDIAGSELPMSRIANLTDDALVIGNRALFSSIIVLLTARQNNLNRKETINLQRQTILKNANDFSVWPIQYMQLCVNSFAIIAQSLKLAVHD